MRDSLMQARAMLQVARREALADADDVSDKRLAGTLPTGDEQEDQSAAALVRTLDNAIRELRDAIQSYDQLKNVRDKSRKAR